MHCHLVEIERHGGPLSSIFVISKTNCWCVDLNLGLLVSEVNTLFFSFSSYILSTKTVPFRCIVCSVVILTISYLKCLTKNHQIQVNFTFIPAGIIWFSKYKIKIEENCAISKCRMETFYFFAIQNLFQLDDNNNAFWLTQWS